MKQIKFRTSQQTNTKKKNSSFVFVIPIITIGIILFVFHTFSPKEIHLDKSKYIEPISYNNEHIEINDISKFETAKRTVPIKGISAKSVYAMNPETGKVYYSKNADLKLPIASVTKIITSLTAYNEYNFNDEISITKKLPVMDIPIGLKVGDRIKVSEVLQCALIASKNDCGNVLASENDNFITLMNSLSDELGLTSSHFSNPTGFINTDNYSSASDLAKISSAFVRNIELVNITDKTSEKIEINGDNKRSIKVNTTNLMLFENKNIKGLKTGFTYEAGECLVLYYDFGGSNKMITVVLGSKDRFKDSRLLYNYIVEEYN